MLDFERKYLINCVHNKNSYSINFDEIDLSKLIDLFIYHNLFLQFYSQIYKDFAVLDKDNIIQKKYLKYIVFIKKIEEIISIIVKIFNNNNIDYRLYKGIAYSKLLYPNLISRFYTDIDIYIQNDQMFYAISLIKQELNIYQVNHNIISHEFKYVIEYLDYKFLIEFKEDTHHLLVIDKKKYFDLKVNNNIVLRTFSLENTFLNMVLYYYYYTQNVIPYLYSYKLKLVYPYEIMLFIDKFLSSVDWNLILLTAIDNKMVNKIRLVLFDIQKLFNKNYKNLIKIFNRKYISNLEIDIVDKGAISRPINVLNRFIYSNEYIDFVKKNLVGEFILGESNKIIHDDVRGFISLKDIEMNYYIIFKRNNIFVNITDVFLFSKNLIVYISIFAYDKNGLLIEPFIPITICNNGCFEISDVYFLDREFGYYCKDEFLKKKNPNINMELIDNNLHVEIDLLNYNVDIKNKIGVKVSAYLHENGKLIEKYNLAENYDKPKILKHFLKGDN